MIDTDKIKPNPFDPFIIIKEYVEWYPENGPAILQRSGTPSIGFAIDLLAEVKRLREENEKLYDFIESHPLIFDGPYIDAWKEMIE